MNTIYRVLLSCLALSLFSAPVCAQLKPEAFLLPVYFVGIKDTSSQRILEQHVLTELSQSFELRTEKEIEAAREKAFDKLASKDCNDVTCLKLMGELLDVEYTFVVLVSASGDYWDITGVRLDRLGKTVRKGLECRDCDLSKSRKALTKLIKMLSPGLTQTQAGEAVLILESQPVGQVFLNGQLQGDTPIELMVSTREPVDILIVAEGYQDYARLFKLQSGQKKTERIQLIRKRGSIRIESEPPGAKIIIDDEERYTLDGKSQRTPADIRPEYGRYRLTLSLEKYEEVSDILIVNKRNLSRKKYVLSSKPGRLLVRVPSLNKWAKIYANDKLLGSMGGAITKTFDVPSLKSLRIRAKDNVAQSYEKTVEVPPDGSKTIIFYELRLPTKLGLNIGFNLIYDNFSIILQGNSAKKINLDYGIFGFGFRGMMVPKGHWVELQFLNGKASRIDPTTPFYIVDGTSSYKVTSASANIVRILYSNLGDPGWTYAFGWEKIIIKLNAEESNLQKMNSNFLITGGYVFDHLIPYKLQNIYPSLSLLTRFSLASGWGICFSLGGSYNMN